MEKSHRQRPNPSSSSSSSTHFRSQKFRSNPTTKDGKFTKNNNPNAREDFVKPRRASQQVQQHVDDSSNLPVLLGTCPFMCPGKKLVTICVCPDSYISYIDWTTSTRVLNLLNHVMGLVQLKSYNMKIWNFGLNYFT